MPATETKPKTETKKTGWMGKHIGNSFLNLVVFVIIGVILIGVVELIDWIYSAVDQTRFPKPAVDVSKVNPKMTETEKGTLLATAITKQLQREMDSTFGLTTNDLIISPTSWLDNRSNRQRGVIFSTLKFTEFFATNVAKFGNADKENESLLEARTQCFNYSPDKWWFYSAEDQYEKGINLVKKYTENLKTGKATYNLRSDDIYNLLMYIIEGSFLDQAYGLVIETNNQISWWDLDDRVYYAQGVVLVLRDFLHTLVALYPEIMEKGGKENIEIAFREMDQFCTFDPIVVTRGEHDSFLADHRSKTSRYLTNIMKRINDVAQSIRR